ncbi:MAG: dihydrolipoyl dehydrogenase [Proteobacteria bacterium]|nr:MAG: dihydrolipoyl dehydrogenase [Pseudomonadota bacterium]
MGTFIDTQAVVIGAGPGGYVCAIRLAQLGVRTVLVDKRWLGGVCLNVGCIPSKALIHASKLVDTIRGAEAMGVHVDGLRVDLRAMMAWKGGVVDKLTGGVGTLVRGNGGQVVMGEARFSGPHDLEVTGADGQRATIRFEHAVIATGSSPASLPGFDFDGDRVVDSTGALAFERLPERMVVVGGGYIGMELGGVYQRLGTEVTVVELADQLLPGFAADLVRPVAKRFRKAGGKIMTRSAALSYRREGDGVVVTVESRKTGERSQLAADVILSTTGRRPNTAGLGLEALGLEVDDKGFVTVDGAQRTAVDHVFAIGDVAGEPLLAHKASKEGEVAAEVIAGKAAAFDARAIPAVCFTDPEIATVGLSVKQARGQGHVVKAGKFPFAANGRALSLGETDGFVRVVMDADSEVLLGVEAVGPDVSALIAEAGLALEMGAVASDLGWTIHAHPTLAEALMEAANAALGHAVHALNR